MIAKIATTVRIPTDDVAVLLYGLQKFGIGNVRSLADALTHVVSIFNNMVTSKCPEVLSLTDLEKSSLLKAMNKLDNVGVKKASEDLFKNYTDKLASEMVMPEIDDDSNLALKQTFNSSKRKCLLPDDFVSDSDSES